MKYVEIRIAVMKRRASVSFDCVWMFEMMVVGRVVRLSMRGGEAAMIKVGVESYCVIETASMAWSSLVIYSPQYVDVERVEVEKKGGRDKKISQIRISPTYVSQPVINPSIRPCDEKGLRN